LVFGFVGYFGTQRKTEKNLSSWIHFIAITIKDIVFWDMTPCGSSKENRCFVEHIASIFRITSNITKSFIVKTLREVQLE
jgi:hypothetical protein